MNEMWFMVAKALVVLGSINWLSVGAFNINLVQCSFLHNIEHALYVVIGLAAIFLSTHRDFFLPFLGRTALPRSVMNDQVPKDADVAVPVMAPPGAKVVYWAAEQSKNDHWDSHKQAYGFYKNAGVATANALGQAILKVRSPSGYFVGWFRKEIKPHVHYRIEDPSHGMWGPVQSVFL